MRLLLSVLLFVVLVAIGMAIASSVDDENGRWYF